MGELMSITAIIPSYNRPDLLSKTLSSFAAQSLVVDEVVIADDGSSVDIPAALEGLLSKLPFSVKFVWQEDLGFRAARARNNGVREARGDFLVFADQDLIFTRNYVKTFAENCRKGEFLVSHPLRLTQEESERVTSEMVDRCDYSALLSEEKLAEVAKLCRKDRLYTLLKRLGLRPIGPKLRSGVFAIWRDDLLLVNGFDEKYKGWGNEDDDLGWRLHYAGVRGRNVTRREVPIHLWHESKAATRTNKEYYRARRKEIKAGDVRAENGIENTFDPDRYTVKILK